MTSRKIQKSRSGSYLVSLPKGWVEDSGLEKGDRVEIKKSEDGFLTLLLSDQKRKLSYELNYEDFPNIGAIENTIKACYMQGAETIKVKSEEAMAEEKEKLRPIVLDLIGSEIFKDRPNLISYRVLVDPTKFSINNLTQRIYNLVTSVHENAIEALEHDNPELVSGASQRGKDAKRIYRLMIRELKISAIDREVAESIGIESKGDDLIYTIAARDLSRMAHHAVRFAELVHQSGDRLSEEDINSLLEISDVVLKMEEKSVTSLLEKDISLASEIVELMDEVRELTDHYVNNPAEGSLDQESCEVHTEGCLDPTMCDLRTSLSRNLRRIAGYSVAIADNATVGAVSKFQE